MGLYAGLLRLQTRGNAHVVNITDAVKNLVRAAETTNAVVVVFVTGSTAAVTTMEFEPGGVEDLRALVDRLVPAERPGGGDYAHNVLNGDDNAHSHLRASLIGPSETIPLVEGHLALGTWQQIVLIDFDDRPRERTVTVQVLTG
jgi:secondary thiamine-phosphate synthase enzyme